MTSVLASGEILTPGEGLWSPSGRYQANFQSDGNFVVYDTHQAPEIGGQPGLAYFSSHTAGTPSAILFMRPDGNPAIYSNAIVFPNNPPAFRVLGSVSWAATPAPVAGSGLSMQDDGNLVLYDPNGVPNWNIFAAIAAGGGNLFTDFTSGVLAIPDAAIGTFVEAIHEIPGVDWAGNQLKDFANTAVGSVFLRAMAGGLIAAGQALQASGGLVGALGPPLAQVAVALPGLAKGNKFIASWTTETAWRISTTINYFVKAISTDVGNRIDAFAEELGNDVQQAFDGLPSIPMSITDLAAQAQFLHVRSDSMLAALDAKNGTSSFAHPALPAMLLPGNIIVGPQPAQKGRSFDPKTGDEILPFNPGILNIGPGFKVLDAQAAAAKTKAVITLGGVGLGALALWYLKPQLAASILRKVYR